MAKRTPWGPKVYLFFAIIPFLWPLLIGVMLEDAYYKFIKWRKAPVMIVFGYALLTMFTVLLATVTGWSIYLDFLTLSAMSEMPPEQWEYVQFHFYRVAIYNLTLTSSAGYATYRSARLFRG